VALSSGMVALLIGGLDERAAAVSVRTATLPANCGVGSLTPIRHAGSIIARAEAECTDPIPYLRVRVILAGKPLDGGVWRHVAAAIGESPVLTTYLLVKVATPCEPGRYRTIEAVRYRYNISDPWTSMVKRFRSPIMAVRRCRSDAA
jgi:hypothetical protein